MGLLDRAVNQMDKITKEKLRDCGFRPTVRFGVTTFAFNVENSSAYVCVDYIEFNNITIFIRTYYCYRKEMYGSYHITSIGDPTMDDVKMALSLAKKFK